MPWCYTNLDWLWIDYKRSALLFQADGGRVHVCTPVSPPAFRYKDDNELHQPENDSIVAVQSAVDGRCR